jgi:hypothetical protein
MKKETYVRPTLKDLGSVADLTRTGGTIPGLDAKGGSVSSRGV